MSNRAAEGKNIRYKGDAKANVEDVILQIVQWVMQGVVDWGAECRFTEVEAVASWTLKWGGFASIHFSDKNNPEPWSREWRHVAQVAIYHSFMAVELAAKAKHQDWIGLSDFELAGDLAQAHCQQRARQEGFRGCWCNDC